MSDNFLMTMFGGWNWLYNGMLKVSVAKAGDGSQFCVYNWQWLRLVLSRAVIVCGKKGGEE